VALAQRNRPTGQGAVSLDLADRTEHQAAIKEMGVWSTYCVVRRRMLHEEIVPRVSTHKDKTGCHLDGEARSGVTISWNSCGCRDKKKDRRIFKVQWKSTKEALNERCTKGGYGGAKRGSLGVGVGQRRRSGRRWKQGVFGDGGRKDAIMTLQDKGDWQQEQVGCRT